MKNEYIEKLKKEISEKFEAGLRADEVRKKPLTLQYRRGIADSIEMGFEIEEKPLIVRNVRRKSEKVEQKKVA